MIKLIKPLPESIAGSYRWQQGDAVVAIDGLAVEDQLDLFYYATDDGEMVLTVQRASGECLEASLAPSALGELTDCLAPLDFKTCACKCVFCFVDQNPAGLRPSIYVRDEDYRLSFLYGNYVTLTSLGARGVERIIEQNLSPLFVSVHATDVDVRTSMLGIRRRIDILPILSQLTASGITVHAQVVLCPGWNDGAVLEKTYRDLLALAPGVASLAIVPVGLTEHRRKLTPLAAVTPELAGEVVRQVCDWQDESRRLIGSALVHLSDEFYLLAGAPFPAASSYDDFPQIDNGIGMTVALRESWRSQLDVARQEGRLPLTPLTILTGIAGRQAIARELLPIVTAEDLPPLDIVGVSNSLFGESVSVTGLLSGRDVQRSLQELPAWPARTVVVSDRMFNNEGLTLDDMSLAAVAADQPHRLLAVSPDGFVDFWAAIR